MEFLTDFISKNIDSQKSFTILLLYSCLSLIFIWYINNLWKKRYMYYHSWSIPGPISAPFIGCGYLFLMNKNLTAVTLFQYLQDRYPDIGAGWFGSKLFYITSKPEYIEKILTSPKAINKCYAFDIVAEALGGGLFTVKEPMWKKHRKAVMPAFNQKILDYYQEIFVEKTEIFVDLLQKQIGNKNIDFFEYVTNCTLDIICQTALGVNMTCQNSSNTFGKNLDRLMHITTVRIVNFEHHILDFAWPLYKMSKEFTECVNEFNSFCEKIVKKKLETFPNSKTRSNSVVQIEEASYKLKNGKIAFLDLIIENTNFTAKELEDEVKTFIMAGTDTTASALCFIFVVLGMYPDIQQKVLDEILDIMGPDRKVVPSDLPHMKYTDRVIKETLRIFPLGILLLRDIQADIDAGDMVFPAGASVLVGAFHLHRNAKYWPDPMKFDPDRFLPENVDKRHPCTYLPFSYGPRNCIGSRYAMMSLKTILATTLRRFKVFTHYKSLEEIELDCHIVLRLKDGPKVWLEERKF